MTERIVLAYPGGLDTRMATAEGSRLGGSSS